MHLHDCLVEALTGHFAADRNLAAVDVDVLLLQRLGDVFPRHRSEEPPILADAHGDVRRDLFELRRHQACLVLRHGVLTRLCPCLCLCHVHVLRARGQR